MGTICFDLDGTLCTNTFGEYESAEPLPWAIDRVRRLADAGHRIIVFTARGTATGIDWEEVTVGQLARWGVPYDELRFGKPSADVYVDDRGVHTDAWRSGDALAAPGLEGLDDGEPAVPRVLPPDVTSVVEVARTFGGRPLRLPEHAERARALAEAAGICDPPQAAEIEERVRAALPSEPLDEDLIVSICVAAAGHQASADVWAPNAAATRVSCRPVREAAVGLQRFAARGDELAIDAATDPVLPGWPLRVDDDGRVVDRLGGELAVVRDARMTVQPAPGPPTVARRWLFELSAALALPALEGPIEAKDLEDADEAFLVGLPFRMLPVASVDGRPIGTGAPGFFTRTLLEAWTRDARLPDREEVAVP